VRAKYACGLTLDYQEKEHKISHHVAQMIKVIAAALHPTTLTPAAARTGPWRWSATRARTTPVASSRVRNPRASAVNKYCQSWDVYNLFIMDAWGFPHNAAYNPTGLVGALASWAADAIRQRYLKHPGPLVQA
jgi:gluconate 2-dehydrogenase alpha chain